MEIELGIRGWFVFGFLCFVAGALLEFFAYGNWLTILTWLPFGVWYMPMWVILVPVAGAIMVILFKG